MMSLAHKEEQSPILFQVKNFWIFPSVFCHLSKLESIQQIS